MPPHCDSMDGPVVMAAQRALQLADVDLVLPYVKADGEDEVRRAYDLVVKARAQGPEAAEVADRYFFETVVRVHRAGEGAPFTGLKRAGLDVGPVIPMAESVLASGRPDDLADLLAAEVRAEVSSRLAAAVDARAAAEGGAGGVAAERAYVEAALGLQVWAHRLHKAIAAPAHG